MGCIREGDLRVEPGDVAAYSPLKAPELELGLPAEPQATAPKTTQRPMPPSKPCLMFMDVPVRMAGRVGQHL